MPPHTTISLPVHTTDALTRGANRGAGIVCQEREPGSNAAAAIVWSTSGPHTTNSWPSHAPCVASAAHPTDGSGIWLHSAVSSVLTPAAGTVVAGVVATDCARCPPRGHSTTP